MNAIAVGKSTPSFGPLGSPAPTTRYQGSKFKLLGWLWQHLAPLPFQTCLDAFGGSGCVSYMLKQQGKSVVMNDLLKSSCLIGQALVENQYERLTDDDVHFVMSPHLGVAYDDLIARTFEGIYFTSDENAWLDQTVQNISLLPGRLKQAMAYYALFQAAIRKRPYNLFHRKNLYMRLAKVSRGFGNKATWDRSFEAHFREFAAMANAAIFAGAKCKSVCGDAAAAEGAFDLVYIDPPYMNQRGQGVDYAGFYHFLEGLADYGNWTARIDFSSKHRRMHPAPSPWTDKRRVYAAFEQLFDQHRQSILAISYRTDGIPTPEELVVLLGRFKQHVAVHRLPRAYKYALSTNADSSELLLIGQD